MRHRVLNPRLLSRRLREARWWMLDYVYAGIGQTRAVLSRARPEDFRSGAESPIVIIPGVYESWRFMRPLIQTLHDHGHPVHVVPALGRNRRSLAEAAATVAAYLERENLTGVIIVAHSKGGLIGKRLMTTDDPERRVTGMVAISAPFAGSRYARYWVVPSIRAFAPANVALHGLGLDTGSTTASPPSTGCSTRTSPRAVNSPAPATSGSASAGTSASSATRRPRGQCSTR